VFQKPQLCQAANDNEFLENLIIENYQSDYNNKKNEENKNNRTNICSRDGFGLQQQK
jgi:hypothetical protein